MPSRAKAEETPQEEKKAPARASRAKKEAVDADAPAHQEPTNDKAEATAKAGTVKKFPLLEKVKKFIKEVAPDVFDAIHETDQQTIEDSEKSKNEVVFVTFTDDHAQEGTPRDFNIECIKSVLFGFHTMEEKARTGKTLFFEVLPETEDAPFILTCQEIGADK